MHMTLKTKAWSSAVGSLIVVSIPHMASAVSVDVCQGGASCDNFITTYINPLVTFLTVVLGVVAALSIVLAGIQYASAGDDPGKVQKAKDRIFETILGILAYLFLFGFLNYLVPGGIF